MVKCDSCNIVKAATMRVSSCERVDNYYQTITKASIALLSWQWWQLLPWQKLLSCGPGLRVSARVETTVARKTIFVRLKYGSFKSTRIVPVTEWKLRFSIVPRAESLCANACYIYRKVEVSGKLTRKLSVRGHDSNPFSTDGPRSR